MVGRPINEALATARLMGDKTYHGMPHSKCGTTERYTSGGGCVYCARNKMVELRQKALTPAAPADTDDDDFLN